MAKSTLKADWLREMRQRKYDDNIDQEKGKSKTPKGRITKKSSAGSDLDTDSSGKSED